MPYNYNLNVPNSSNPGIDQDTSPGKVFIPVRVVDVILDSTHSEYEKYGRSRAIGVIKYCPLSEDRDKSDSESLQEAYPISATIRTLPLKNEVVLLITAPSDGLDVSPSTTRAYYTTIVNMWNHPNHGAFPETNTLDLGDEIEEATDVNPLQPFPGDLILDGRQGQSLRMTGFKSKQNPFVDESNQGKPLTILSNGQKLISNSYDFITEDVNLDASSIYLTSDHSIPLNEASKVRKSYDKAPAGAKEYKGAQVLINSGRLYFNAKTENILMSSAQSIGLSGNTVNIDSLKNISLDGPEIYLGALSRNKKQPAVLGDKLEEYLKGILDVLQEIGQGLTTGAYTPGGAPLPMLIKLGTLITEAVEKGPDNLRSKINPGGASPLKSKKVFTE